MANIGYIQVVGYCNHTCGFCSCNGTTERHSVDEVKYIIGDFAQRNYFGIVLTGGEPTLHPDLPLMVKYGRQQGLHVRIISNGKTLADPDYARILGDAGLQLVHISIYSVRAEIERQLRGVEGSIDLACRAIENCHQQGIDVQINTVINKLNANHLEENVSFLVQKYPFLNHFVWNNIDPSMGKAVDTKERYLSSLADMELSLYNSLKFLDESNRTFRVEKVPLCYMTDYAWASTETRKIVKEEERIVHFIFNRDTIRQRKWEYRHYEPCEICHLNTICAGLYHRGEGYDPTELHPLFIPTAPIVDKILKLC